MTVITVILLCETATFQAMASRRATIQMVQSRSNVKSLPFPFMEMSCELLRSLANDTLYGSDHVLNG
jgi:hypothetical protein